MFQNTTSQNASITGITSAISTWLLELLPSWSQAFDLFINIGQLAGAALAIASLYEFIKLKNKGK